MKCNHCGKDFDGAFCPDCGMKAVPEVIQAQPEATEPIKTKKKKKPFFLKWWFIAFVVIIAAVAVSRGEDSEKIVWNDMLMAEFIPEAPKNKGKIISNSSEEMDIDINKINETEYEKYVLACKEAGFIVDAVKDSYSYKAYNAEGYRLYLSHMSFGETMGIKLEAPMEMTTIKWPSGEAGKQLPAPKSAKGCFSFEHDDSFNVYIGDTTKQEYEEYIEACIKKGFNVDYDKGENNYFADNEKGWHIAVRYEGFNIMSIDIDPPEEEQSITQTTAPTTTTEETTQTATEQTTTEQATTTTTQTALVDGMRPEFKQAMDSYETFMTDYVDFMNKFSEDSTDISLLADYADYMKKYAEFVEDFEKWDDDTEMNDAEMAYYIDVQARVSKKLLEVN